MVRKHLFKMKNIALVENLGSDFYKARLNFFVFKKNGYRVISYYP